MKFSWRCGRRAAQLTLFEAQSDARYGRAAASAEDGLGTRFRDPRDLRPALTAGPPVTEATAEALPCDRRGPGRRPGARGGPAAGPSTFVASRSPMTWPPPQARSCGLTRLSTGAARRMPTFASCSHPASGRPGRTSTRDRARHRRRHHPCSGNPRVAEASSAWPAPGQAVRAADDLVRSGRWAQRHQVAVGDLEARRSASSATAASGSGSPAGPRVRDAGARLRSGHRPS